MIKQIECRILESRPLSPASSLSRPNRRIESIEKPRPRGGEIRYDLLSRPAGAGQTYNFRGRTIGWTWPVSRIDVRA